MKRFFQTFIYIMALFLLGTACDPIVDRDSLSNSFNPDDIKLEVIQSTEGGNGLTLKMNTPGVAGYWDYNIDKSFTDKVVVNYPIPGKAVFTYHVTTAYMEGNDPAKTSYVSKQIEVQIDQLDQELPPNYYRLVGNDLEGKKWVFDGGPGADDRMWWYMSPGNDPTQWATAWWNAGGTGAGPADASGYMQFDLNGAANYTYHDGSTSQLGSFKFNKDYTKLTLMNAPILGNDSQRINADGEYQIIELTEEKMILYNPVSAGGTGWTWIFKPMN
ncbi:hypothetical protein K4L44_04485 [Halosquirtibacter laminarini]|uniref:Uncharacterized protein n=1 Tax=Halosquirtibacter laminarini TaxID=3374600 RepID=A0AC61NLT0_9BACT|nr:hypothetical protein K4L44_04485 [Prolixibacteraceae bacterium]